MDSLPIWWGGEAEAEAVITAVGCQSVDVVDIIAVAFEVVAGDAVPPVPCGIWVGELGTAQQGPRIRQNNRIPRKHHLPCCGGRA